MKRIVLIFALIIFLCAACSFGNQGPGGDIPDQADAAPQSEKRCGDGVCDGPETAEKCPEDCAGPIIGRAADDENEEDAEPPKNQPVQDVDLPESGYRKVSISGTIEAELNPAKMDGFTGDAFEYTGGYSIELWFPLTGGEPVQQRNTLALTELHDVFIGDPECRPCDWNLDASAYEPVSFELDASLNLEAIQEGEKTVDELVYQLTTVPMVILTGFVECPCGPGDDFADPAAIPALATWFMQGLRNPIILQSLENNTVEDFPAGPIYNISIPDEVLFYTVVDGLD